MEMWGTIVTFPFSFGQPGPTLSQGVYNARLLLILQQREVFRGGLLCSLTVLNVFIAVNTFGRQHKKVRDVIDTKGPFPVQCISHKTYMIEGFDIRSIVAKVRTGMTNQLEIKSFCCQAKKESSAVKVCTGSLSAPEGHSCIYVALRSHMSCSL